MKLSRYIRETFDTLEELGLAPIVISSNKHYRVRISHPIDRSITTVLTIGFSESDYRAVKNTRGRISRFIKTGSQDGNPKEPNSL